MDTYFYIMIVSKESMEYITNHEYYRLYNPVPVFTKKEPPMKGTKRWDKQQKAIKRKERRREIWNVINLIDSLSVGACVAHAQEGICYETCNLFIGSFGYYAYITLPDAIR